jgi:hypothetical protein
MRLGGGHGNEQLDALDSYWTTTLDQIGSRHTMTTNSGRSQVCYCRLSRFVDHRRHKSTGINTKFRCECDTGRTE